MIVDVRYGLVTNALFVLSYCTADNDTERIIKQEFNGVLNDKLNGIMKGNDLNTDGNFLGINYEGETKERINYVIEHVVYHLAKEYSLKVKLSISEVHDIS